MYLLSVPSVSSRYSNKIKRTSYLGKQPALSLEILSYGDSLEQGKQKFVQMVEDGHHAHKWLKPI